MYGFDGIEPGEPSTPEGDGTTIFYETMGASTVSKDGNYWPYVSSFANWSNSNLTFTDVNSTLSVRAVGSTNNIWFPAGKDNDLQISGFDATGYTSLTLTYDVAANLHNAGEEQDMGAMTGMFNDQAFSTPAKLLTADNGDDSKFYSVTIDLPVSAATASSTLHFKTTATDNKMGLRLANIRLVGKK